MSVPVQTAEPLTFSAGDTVSFLKTLQDFPASSGWQIKYELTLATGAAPIEFVSTAQADSHKILVAAATTAAWAAGDYVLSGYAVNSGTSERAQVYLNVCKVTANLQTSSASQETHAQKMLRLIEAVQLGKATHDILESDIEQTRIKRLSPKELREERNYWLAERQREIQKANVAAGRSNGRNRYVAFVDPAGGGIGQFGASPIYPLGR